MRGIVSGINSGLKTLDRQVLIDIANAADANNDTIKSDVVTKVNTALGTTLTNASTWTQIRAAIVKDPDKVTGNIRAGVNIDGVAGKTEVVDTTTAIGATTAQVLTGKEVFINGVKSTGIMLNRTSTLQGSTGVANGVGDVTLTPPAGFYDGSTAQVKAFDADFIAANIKSGINIFGLVGTLSAKQFATGTANINTSQHFIISGLGFVPKIAIIYSRGSNTINDKGLIGMAFNIGSSPIYFNGSFFTESFGKMGSNSASILAASNGSVVWNASGFDWNVGGGGDMAIGYYIFD